MKVYLDKDIIEIVNKQRGNVTTSSYINFIFGEYYTAMGKLSDETCPLPKPRTIPLDRRTPQEKYIGIPVK